MLILVASACMADSQRWSFLHARLVTADSPCNQSLEPKCGNAGKTVEVRRSEAVGDKGKSDTAAQLRRLFYISTEDRNRAQIGLPPMPKPVPPPPPPSKERTQEILDDDRVKVRDTCHGAVAAQIRPSQCCTNSCNDHSDSNQFDR